MNSINLTALLVARQRDNEKICYMGSEFQLSYRELDRAVRRQAAWLVREGICNGERIIIALDDGPEMVIIFFASLAIGALPAVTNPRLDATSLSALIADVQPALCYGHSSQAAVWPTVTRLCLLDVGTYRSWLESPHVDDDWNDFVFKSEEEPALIQYTSGSTGHAKGVLHNARSILSVCSTFAAKQLGLSADDVLYSVPKAFFGYGMGNSLFFPLYLGASAVLDAAWPSAVQVKTLLKQFRPSVLFAVPTMYRMLLEQELKVQDVSVRLAFSAGAPLSANTAARWKQRFDIDLHDGIGATELCHVFATSYPDAVRSGSVGRILPGWQARIVDVEGRIVPYDECGVLMVKSPSCALGYWQRPQDEATRFVDGWYRTGDLFSMDADGYLFFHGREDDRFKVYGRWVAPVEIENLLASLLPELGDCFLVPGCDGNGENRPCLILHAASDPETLIRLTRITLDVNLESYKQPVLVIALADVPLNKNGKPDRRTMARLASQALNDTDYSVNRGENIC
ncbi:CoA ligase [Verminephrobacter eiseniae]|uniref:AMP-binding protein n=1 Tax=Verminephrobacter eiseniae TaxID=364317 RepID=UPI002238D91F|nr:AMP-binding protein [Verminephrobacter eiseniae]MCW5262533.1 CoA ligase [Verminephrobacter eiseniae]